MHLGVGDDQDTRIVTELTANSQPRAIPVGPVGLKQIPGNPLRTTKDVLWADLQNLQRPLTHGTTLSFDEQTLPHPNPVLRSEATENGQHLA